MNRILTFTFAFQVDQSWAGARDLRQVKRIQLKPLTTLLLHFYFYVSIFNKEFLHNLTRFLSVADGRGEGREALVKIKNLFFNNRKFEYEPVAGIISGMMRI